MNPATSIAGEAPSSTLRPLTASLSRLVPLSREEQAAVESLPHEVRSVAGGTILVEASRVETHCHVLLDAFAHKEKFFGDLRRVVAINLPGELVNIESALAMASDYEATVFRAGQIAIIPAAAVRELLFSFPSLGRAFWLRNQAEGATYREWLLNDQRPTSRRGSRI